LQNPDNPKLIFHIERVEGKFDADNKVYGTNARMVLDVHGNEIGEFNALSSARNLLNWNVTQDSLVEMPSPAMLSPLPADLLFYVRVAV